jgi:hypothetical protein
MPILRNAERAIVDERKVRDYAVLTRMRVLHSSESF